MATKTIGPLISARGIDCVWEPINEEKGRKELTISSKFSYSSAFKDSNVSNLT